MQTRFLWLRRRAVLASSIAAMVALTMLPGVAIGAVSATNYCYEDQALLSAGKLWSNGSGSGHFDSAVLGEEPSVDQGGGTIEWKYKARVLGPNTDDSDGSLRGFIRATITWDDTALGVTVYKSACISDARGDSSTFDEDPEGRLEAKYEGLVWNFPGSTDAAGQAAMAEIGLTKEAGVAVLTFSVELGTDCFDGPDEPEFTTSDATGGWFTASGHGGRASFPAEAGGPDGC